MKTSASFRYGLGSSLLLLIITHQVASILIKDFDCSKDDNIPADYFLQQPKLPEAFSTNIQANIVYEGGNPGKTIEMKYMVDTKQKKELIEFKSNEIKVQYIFRQDQNVTLKIIFKEDEYPVCDVTKTKELDEFFNTMDSKDTGPNEILKKTMLLFKQFRKFTNKGADTKDGVFATRWVHCSSDPKINVSLSFMVPTWTQAYDSAAKVNYTIRGDAQIGNVDATLLFSNYDPTKPDYKVFQPPENVYCKGLKSKNTFPRIEDYFRYNAEVIMYESGSAIAPVMTYRKVYYDYPSGLARMDFYDIVYKSGDMFEAAWSHKKSFIHDYHAGIEYSLYTLRGKCEINPLESTFDVVAVDTEDNKLLKGTEFFYLNNAELSYNGQFPVRGVTADVYTAIVGDPHNKDKTVVSWYFSTKETRVVEEEIVERNVLLRMSFRPETGYGKKDNMVIDFYEFVNEQPSVDSFDITSCYNATDSKLLVLTFPADDSLRGFEKRIGVMTYLTIEKITALRRSRISIREVAANEKYLFVEFFLLEAPPNTNETSLDDAVSKIQNAISKKTFVVETAVDGKVVKLEPEPDGLNVFSGDRVRLPTTAGYKEGSVIGMAIGLLILGFLLGFVTLNLIMSRKFGVSLFQKAKYGSGPFHDENESKI